MSEQPKIAVLLASYNGAEWIEAQMRSILDAKDVQTHIFLSDDGSTDDTVAIANRVGAAALTVLEADPQGSASQNFFRLVRDAQWDDFDYVALADQDDVWRPEKLRRAIDKIKGENLSAYSCDITAFWPDGRRLYIKKSQPQQRWDHLFEGGGPGNTFVWPRAEADFLRRKLSDTDPALLRSLDFHDWVFFAVFREAGKHWLIDDYSGLDYRQHDLNVMGAANGLTAVMTRLKMFRKGWYSDQVLLIADMVGAENPVLDYLRKPGPARFWVPIVYARHCRRKTSQAVGLAVALATMAFGKRPH